MDNLKGSDMDVEALVKMIKHLDGAMPRLYIARLLMVIKRTKRKYINKLTNRIIETSDHEKSSNLLVGALFNGEQGILIILTLQKSLFP